MRKNGTSLLLLCFLLFAGWDGLPAARATNPLDDPGDNHTIDNDPDSQQVPLDDGLALLLAAGAGYGLRKYHSAARPKEGAI